MQDTLRTRGKVFWHGQPWPLLLHTLPYRWLSIHFSRFCLCCCLFWWWACWAGLRSHHWGTVLVPCVINDVFGKSPLASLQWREGRKQERVGSLGRRPAKDLVLV